VLIINTSQETILRESWRCWFWANNL